MAATIVNPRIFRNGNSVLMNSVIDNQPYLYPVKDLYISNDNIHLGTGAGGLGVTSYVYQQTGSVAIGGYSSQNYQGKLAVAIGYESGQQYQGDYSIAIGYDAGQNNQGIRSISVGPNSGQNNQSEYSISVGVNAGQNNQLNESIAIGLVSGETNQQNNSIAIGSYAGYVNQGTGNGYAISIGNQAGRINQGEHTIAIGDQAGYSNQHSKSIIINASGISLDSSSTGGFFVKPINRNENYVDFQTVRYKPSSGEITYSYPVAGVITMYGGTAAPLGTLLCDGTEVSRTTYSRLFDAIGTIYGSGNGTGTFNLPNLQGRVPVGLKSSETIFNTLGNIGGTGAHTLSVEEIPAHTHSYFNQPNSVSVQIPITGTDVADNVNVSQTSGSTGGGLAHNNLQPYIVLNYIISY